MPNLVTRGDVFAAFASMRIEHPRLVAAHQLFDSLREAKAKASNEPQKFGAIFAPPQSGKTMSVKTYIETKVVDDAIRLGLFPSDMDRAEIAIQQRLVLHITLSAKATPKSLASDILKAFGDPRATNGDGESLLKRAYDYMRYYGTTLLCIDEIQHLGHRTTKGSSTRSGVVESTAVTDTLKCMLLNGLVPMVFVGISEARPLLFCDPQLASRCVECLDFGQLDYSRPDQRKIFVEYCGTLGLKLRQHGLFPDLTNLVVGDIPACIHAVADGRLGMASNLVLAACQVALREGVSSLSREHLATAVQEWAMEIGAVDYNPFVQGIRGYTVRAAQ